MGSDNVSVVRWNVQIETLVMAMGRVELKGMENIYYMIGIKQKSKRTSIVLWTKILVCPKTLLRF